MSEDQKSRMAARLLTLDRLQSPSLGLPKFPVITAETELCDLVTEASWEFFDLVNSDPLPWLTRPVGEWESHPDFQKVKAFVSTVKVVNDVKNDTNNRVVDKTKNDEFIKITETIIAIKKVRAVANCQDCKNVNVVKNVKAKEIVKSLLKLSMLLKKMLRNC